ncbi:MAG: SpaA isopeptide-forming pilin-related protein [Actinobacteria bacterium]|nr:SpaA isopeptide-forming pilin-related protein [Actinomycetota bacterium]
MGNGSFAPGSDSVLTDASGNFTYNYILDGILGTYTVRAVDNAGAVIATTTFTDSSNDITVHKFGDTNGNGTQGGSEPDLSGVQFKLEKYYSGSWHNISTKTTDSDGDAKWTSQEDGTYRITELNTPSGYQPNTGEKWNGYIDNDKTINVPNTPIPPGPKTSLTVTKTATASSEGYIEWSIDKSVTPSSFNLLTGQTDTAHYTVTVTPAFNATGGVVSGNIHIQNDTGDPGEDKTAQITYVKDKIEYKIGSGGSWTVLKTEDIITVPYTIPTGGTNDVPYSVSFTPVPGATAYRNTALVGLANHPDGFHEFHYTISFTISGGTITNDAYADVTDSLQGPLGTAWVGNPATYTYTYDRQVGPYAVFGDYTIDNTATVTGKNTGSTDTDSARVTVHVTGLGSVTVYKNVKAPNGSETSDDHHFNVKLYKKVGTWVYVGQQAFWEGHPAVFTGLEQGKEYKAVEDNDDAYTFVSNSGPVTLNSDNADITIVNKQREGTVYVRKDVKDGDGGSVSDGHHFFVDLYMWIGPDPDDWQYIGQDEFWEGHRAEFEHLIKGRLYKAVEVSDPDYTMWSNDGPKSLDCDVEITIVNRQNEGEVKFTKTGLGSGITAKFKLFWVGPNGIAEHGSGDDVQFDGEKSLTGSGSPHTHWDDVPFGTYYIMESLVPTGYSAMPDITGIVIDENGEEVQVTGNNTLAKGTIIVHKDVLDPEGNPTTDSAIFQFKLDGGSAQDIKDGDAITISDVLAGSHNVEEVTIPTGYSFYSISSNPAGATVGQKVTFDVVSDGTTHVYIVNKQQKANIDVYKIVQDPDGNVTTDLTHFQVNLKDDEGNIIDTKDFWADGDNGEAEFEVNPGTYEIEEVTPLPDGYHYVSGNTNDITVGPGDDQDFTITNQQDPGSITINKTDAFTGLPLEGSTFELWKYPGPTLIDTIVLGPGSGGTHTWSGLSWGHYIVKETIAPTGYELAPPVDVFIGVGEGESLNVTLQKEIADPRIPAQLRLLKTDSVTGLPVPGATYNIYNSSAVLVEIITTGPDGFAAVTLINWGTYTVKEATAPAGYLLDPTTYSITFDAANTSITLNVKDTPAGGGGGGTITVAGLTEGTIQVLAFTGMDPIIPISGGSAVIAGLAMILATLRRRTVKK